MELSTPLEGLTSLGTMQNSFQIGDVVNNLNQGTQSSLSPRKISLVIFTLFPALPLELRRKIWRESITPRIIYVSSLSPVLGEVERYMYKVITSSTIPLLSANKESRFEVLKLYEQPFNNQHVLGQTDPCRPPCYVNFAQDLIFIDESHVHYELPFIFKLNLPSRDGFMNVALSEVGLSRLDFCLYLMVQHQNDVPCTLFDQSNRSGPCTLFDRFAGKWENSPLRYIRELVLVVDYLQHRKHPKKFVIGNKTDRLTPTRKTWETTFAAFKLQVPEAVLPELRTCYRLLGPK